MWSFCSFAAQLEDCNQPPAQMSFSICLLPFSKFRSWMLVPPLQICYHNLWLNCPTEFFVFILRTKMLFFIYNLLQIELHFFAFFLDRIHKVRLFLPARMASQSCSSVEYMPGQQPCPKCGLINSFLHWDFFSMCRVLFSFLVRYFFLIMGKK